MLRVRLQRIGRKKRPFYRVVVIENTKGPSGKYVEKLGHYNPISNPKEFKINEERLAYWLSCGAKTSDTVAKLIVRYCADKKLIKDFGIDKIVEELKKKPKRPPKKQQEETAKGEVEVKEARSSSEINEGGEEKIEEEKVEKEVLEEEKEKESQVESAEESKNGEENSEKEENENKEI